MCITLYIHQTLHDTRELCVINPNGLVVYNPWAEPARYQCTCAYFRPTDVSAEAGRECRWHPGCCVLTRARMCYRTGCDLYAQYHFVTKPGGRGPGVTDFGPDQAAVAGLRLDFFAAGRRLWEALRRAADADDNEAAVKTCFANLGMAGRVDELVEHDVATAARWRAEALAHARRLMVLAARWRDEARARGWPCDARIDSCPGVGGPRALTGLRVVRRSPPDVWDEMMAAGEGPPLDDDLVDSVLVDRIVGLDAAWVRDTERRVRESNPVHTRSLELEVEMADPPLLAALDGEREDRLGTTFFPSIRGGAGHQPGKPDYDDGEDEDDDGAIDLALINPISAAFTSAHRRNRSDSWPMLLAGEDEDQVDEWAIWHRRLAEFQDHRKQESEAHKMHEDVVDALDTGHTAGTGGARRGRLAHLVMRPPADEIDDEEVAMENVLDWEGVQDPALYEVDALLPEPRVPEEALVIDPDSPLGEINPDHFDELERTSVNRLQRSTPSSPIESGNTDDSGMVARPPGRRAARLRHRGILRSRSTDALPTDLASNSASDSDWDSDDEGGRDYVPRRRRVGPAIRHRHRLPSARVLLAPDPDEPMSDEQPRGKKKSRGLLGRRSRG